MDDQTMLMMWALGLLVVLDVWALYLGYDGAVLAAVVGVLGYATGYKHRTSKAPFSQFSKK